MCAFFALIMQVHGGKVSNSMPELSSKNPDIRRHTGRNARCCHGMKKVSILPGLSHVTYGWITCGCQKSFLEISYSDDPTNGHCDLQSCITDRSPTCLCKPCSTVEKTTADKGHAPREKCNKWPVHNSLTLVCDSRPSQTNSHCDLRSRSKERLLTFPCRSCSTVEKSGTANKGHVPCEQCNKWPVHNSLTLVCDSRPSQINGHRSKESLPTCPYRSCSTVEKSGTAGKVHVPREQCNKWPVHNSLTLVCDSRPSQINGHCDPRSKEKVSDLSL